ncbi:unnamed protein product [Arabidopsis lyrata]|uniref:Predicted protein n=1 Tax=Arabidopsis lyrata subsp. lyrata TaxID=81972 RepID=D7MEC4_ARALL|nr:predicted protein [Arabidopsis lyrata subsp. lyrata]CAH8274327.1 unnamed protein product [Arabidopsis lyrata]
MSPKLPFTAEVVIMTPTNSTAMNNPMSTGCQPKEARMERLSNEIKGASGSAT